MSTVGPMFMSQSEKEEWDNLMKDIEGKIWYSSYMKQKYKEQGQNSFEKDLEDVRRMLDDD